MTTRKGRRCGCRDRRGNPKTPIATRAEAERILVQLVARDGSTRMNVYPCPSGAGFHVGHARGLAKDIRRAIAAGSSAAAANRRRRRRR